MTETDGKIYHVLRLEESVLSKWLYYPKAIYRFSEIPIKLPMAFVTELEQFFLSYMETLKTLNTQSNLEKEKWSWKNQDSWLQTILQSHSHQNIVILTQKQNYWSIQKDRNPRYKPMDLWSTNLLQMRQEYTMGKKQLQK